MANYRSPGLYKVDVFSEPKQGEIPTGVPVFLGYVENPPDNSVQTQTPIVLEKWLDFENKFYSAKKQGYLADAVRGFFENEGRQCVVVALDQLLTPVQALRKGLEVVEAWDTIDLVCAPDIVNEKNEQDIYQMQIDILEHCERMGDRFAILDSVFESEVADMITQQDKLKSNYGALYYSWIKVSGGRFVPPCGHIAGIYARVDLREWVHKAPANEEVFGAVDLEVDITNVHQDQLNPKGINCIRAFPGRGIRLWGARTLSDDPIYLYINVRRVLLTIGRWIERDLTFASFEPNDHNLWAKIEREIKAYLRKLFMKGVFAGSTPEESYYVKCDAETNPKEVIDIGQVITEIGLAATIPNEYVSLRIVHGVGGVSIFEEDYIPIAQPINSSTSDAETPPETPPRHQGGGPPETSPGHQGGSPPETPPGHQGNGPSGGSSGSQGHGGGSSSSGNNG